MSKNKPERRPSPLSGPGGKGIDPSVQAVQRRTARLAHGRERQKVNVYLPVNLIGVLKQEAASLTGHKRRGFSDLVTVLIEYGWKAYQEGELELELQPVTVQVRITAVREGGHS